MNEFKKAYEERMKIIKEFDLEKAKQEYGEDWDVWAAYTLTIKSEVVDNKGHRFEYCNPISVTIETAKYYGNDLLTDILAEKLKAKMRDMVEEQQRLLDEE